MTAGNINLTQLRERVAHGESHAGLSRTELLALIDTAEAAIELMLVQRSQGLTPPAHDRLRETLNPYTTTPTP